MLKYDLISLKILKSLKDSNENSHPLTSLQDSESNYLIGFDQSTSQSPHVLCRITSKFLQISFMLKMENTEMNNAIGACTRFLISVN